MHHRGMAIQTNLDAIICAGGLALMLAIAAQAASIGGPETQGQGKIALEAEWDGIFRRDLTFQSASRPPHHENDQPENFRINGGNHYAGKLTCGVFDFLDLYVKLGAADYRLAGDVFVNDVPAVSENLWASTALLYGGGAKLAYAIAESWIIGLDAQYLASDHTLDFTATSAAGAVTKATYGTALIQEWHTAPFIAWKIASFTPYVGGRYSDLRLNQKDPDDPKRWDHLHFRAANNIGVFAGADWNLGQHFKVNVEGRCLDETALSVGAAFRF